MTEVAILMAVFNGEAFLEQQLDSIVNQSYSNWQLFIRDDGSKDKSKEIINKYLIKYAEKIHFFNDEEKNLGSCNNFFYLLEKVNADYYMFADQDDVWNSDKIEISLKKIKDIENINGVIKPILLHTDLEVVDVNLGTISKSFWNYQQMDIKNGKLTNKLLLQNIVTGCTAIFNRSLKEKLNLIPKNVFVHDWWITLVASVFGIIDEIDFATVKYRQHGNNVAGAKFTNLTHFISRFMRLDEVKQGLRNSVFQSKVFMEIYENQMDKNTLEMFNHFSNLFNYNWVKRRKVLIKYKILKSNFARNVGLFIVA